MLYIDAIITYKDYIYGFCFKDSISLFPSCMSARLVLEKIKAGYNISDLSYYSRDWFWYGHDLDKVSRYSLENDFYKIDEQGLVYGFTDIGKNCVRDGLIDLILPEKVNDIPVKKIGTSAFSGSKIEFIFLPDGLKEIERNAFYYTNLKFISLPNSVEIIGDCVFENCYDLEDVELGNNIKEIGGCAFSNCVNLKELYIPNSIEFIGNNCFMGVSDIIITIDKSKSDINIKSKIVVVDNFFTDDEVETIFGKKMIENEECNLFFDVFCSSKVNYLR